MLWLRVNTFKIVLCYSWPFLQHLPSLLSRKRKHYQKTFSLWLPPEPMCLCEVSSLAKEKKNKAQPCAFAIIRKSTDSKQGTFYLREATVLLSVRVFFIKQFPSLSFFSLLAFCWIVEEVLTILFPFFFSGFNAYPAERSANSRDRCRGQRSAKKVRQVVQKANNYVPSEGSCQKVSITSQISWKHFSKKSWCSMLWIQK